MSNCNDYLSWATESKLIEQQDCFETYIVNVDNIRYCVIILTYEYKDTQINYQTPWFDSEKKALDYYSKEFYDEII